MWWVHWDPASVEGRAGEKSEWGEEKRKWSKQRKGEELGGERK